MPTNNEFALGVDIGGTFIDFVLLHRPTRKMQTGKTLTRYDDLAAAVIEGIRNLMAKGKGHEFGASLGSVVHGTTLATNALIQRRGPVTALITNRGFRDVLEMARESRFDIFDLEIDLPSPLVPRQLVFEVTGRIDYTGREVTPLDREEARSVAKRLKRLRVASAAVSLLHSYRNASHERAIAEILREEMPQLAVSLSSEVSPDIREYERASTTTANAFVQPLVKRYLERLKDELQQIEISAELLIMTSDGACVSCQTAQRYPVRLVESGPAGGALGASFISAQAGISKLIAFDMGGTTAKTCVIDDGEPERSSVFEVGRIYHFAKGSGLPLNIPSIEMIEIGAGGGSIARISDLGLLQVGPDSASSDPGPACYAIGGTQPTVTDADLYLGYLGSESFLGGRMRLDAERAKCAIEEVIAKPLGLSLIRAAWGIHEVVNDNMARAAKIHCLERGKDPRNYSLLAYGGAGPVHAYRVAEALNIRNLLVPLRAGVMSAFGFLVSPPAFKMMRAGGGLLVEANLSEINSLLGEMEAEGRAQVKTAGVKDTDCIVSREIGLRFSGQSYHLTVPAPGGILSLDDLPLIRQRFLDLYEARYHRANADLPIQVVNWHVVVSGPPPTTVSRREDKPPQHLPVAPRGNRAAYMPEVDEFILCPVYDRDALGVGTSFTGPAIIEEEESTLVIGPGSTARVDLDLNLLIALPEHSPRSARRLASNLSLTATN